MPEMTLSRAWLCSAQASLPILDCSFSLFLFASVEKALSKGDEWESFTLKKSLV